MAKLLTWTLSLLLLVAFTGLAVAGTAENAPAKKAKKAKQAKADDAAGAKSPAKADEPTTVKGKVKSVDADQGTLTLTVEEKDQTFTVAKDVKVTQLTGKKAKKATPTDVADGLKGVPNAKEVTLTVEKKDGKDTVTAIRIEFEAKKKKNKNP